MTTVWRCSVCEAVNQGGRECAACGAVMTRRSAASTAVRGRLAAPPTPPPYQPLPRPVERAINREPVVEDEWPYDDELSYRMIPVPGGCILMGTPRRPSGRGTRTP